jgi:hypothetical protein
MPNDVMGAIVYEKMHHKQLQEPQINPCKQNSSRQIELVQHLTSSKLLKRIKTSYLKSGY